MKLSSQFNEDRNLKSCHILSDEFVAYNKELVSKTLNAKNKESGEQFNEKKIKSILKKG